MVLPEPTSPCTSRFMGAPEAVSTATSSMARRWAAVREKGSSARNSSTGGVEKGTPSAQVRRVRSRAMPQARQNSSSKISRRRASSRASSSRGKWMFRQANSAAARACSRRSPAGSVSSICPAHSSTQRRVSPASRLLEIPRVRG